MRRTVQLAAVLEAIRVAGGEAYGLEILVVTGLKSGTLYPLLARAEYEGLVTSRWEERNPTNRGPRRRHYSITSHGGAVLSEMPSPLLRAATAMRFA